MITLLAAAALAANPGNGLHCANALEQRTAVPSGHPPEHKLGDLPPAQLTRLVLRRVDGCALAEVWRTPGGWIEIPAGPAPPRVQPALAPPETPK